MSRRRFSDTWVAVGILLVLVGVITVSALLSPDKAQLPALSSRSTQKNGSKALYSWLQQLGYPLSNNPGRAFAVPVGTRAAFLLEPDPNIALQGSEWEALDQFVRNGGILVSAGDGNGNAAVAAHYGFAIKQAGYNHYVVPFVPGLHSPPLDFDKIKFQSTYTYLDRSTFDYLPLLVEDNHPYAVSLSKGKGQVILVANGALFSNAGLKESGAAELLLNLLAPIPRGSQIWFDEWHHGERSTETTRSGLEDWLVYTPVGQAVLWALLVAFVGLALTGRHFGRPLALEKESARRAPLEFVNALASLNQRTGRRGEVIRGYSRRLKRSLSQRYRIDPDLPDSEIVRQLAEIHPEIDTPALLDLLKRLDRRNPSEQEMVERAHQAAEWIQKLEQPSIGETLK